MGQQGPVREAGEGRRHVRNLRGRRHVAEDVDNAILEAETIAFREAEKLMPAMMLAAAFTKKR